MDFIDRLRELAARLPKQRDMIQTEEATKNALIMPFISALGYNVFDPTEVTPELCADVGVKKGEKVDYAILRDGKPVMLFECKHHTADLGKVHASQLYRYFSVTDARFGVLTNGVVYWFYTDLDAPNKMDGKPFFEFNLLDFKESDIDELKKFSKGAFDVGNILTTASELKYTREITRILAEQMTTPSDEFVKLILHRIYAGRITQAVREQFATLTRQAFKQLVNDQINDRLKTALGSDAPVVETPAVEAVSTAAPSESAVVTTDDELEAYHIVRAIVREQVSVSRIVMRDVQSYCGILVDDNNRKPICRLRFNGQQKYLGLFADPVDGEKDTLIEERIPLASLDDIYRYADRLKATAVRHAQKRTGKRETNGVATS